MICAKCGSPIKEGDMFCGECGSKVESVSAAPAANVCRVCGSVLKPDDVFCGECGSRVEEYAPETERTDPLPGSAEVRFCGECGRKLEIGETKCPVCDPERSSKRVDPVTEPLTGAIKITMREAEKVSSEEKEAGEIYFRRPREI